MKRRISLVLMAAVTAIGLHLFISPLNAATERRTALVIGNSAYPVSPLRNPVNDATDMAAALRDLGFSVTLRTDADQRSMAEAIREFGRRLRAGGVGLFYFAGHGLQYQGRNYLIPVRAEIASEADVRYEAVDAGRVLAQMEDAGNGLNIIVLDACRNNPFARSFRSSEQGLAKMDAPTGSILAYATAPGSVAADGSGRNGLYTAMLLKHMSAPGVDLPHLFMDVRKDVVSATNRQQVPWESSSLIGDFYFVPARAISVQERPIKTPVPPTPVPAMGALPATGQRQNDLGMSFATIPAGGFTMGSPASEPGHQEDEHPHRVTLTRGFFIQTTEVTQGQWKAVTGNNPSCFKTCGDECPVEQVSWNDVQEFIRQLNAMTGERYRLPTEVEWEYAARAGSASAFANGGITATQCDRDPNLDALGWYCADNDSTHPVARKQPNAWGLYDMHGNVSEWVQDWYSDYPSEAVTDPKPQRAYGATHRVNRGGGGNYKVEYCRSAARGTHDPGDRRCNLGFRLARDK